MMFDYLRNTNDIVKFMESIQSDYEGLIKKLERARNGDWAGENGSLASLNVAEFLHWNGIDLIGLARQAELAGGVKMRIEELLRERSFTDEQAVEAVYRTALREGLRDYQISSRSTLASSNYDEDYTRAFWQAIANGIQRSRVLQEQIAQDKADKKDQK